MTRRTASAAATLGLTLALGLTLGPAEARAQAPAASGTRPGAEELALVARREAGSGSGYSYVAEYPAFPGLPEATRFIASFVEETIAAFIRDGCENSSSWEATASPEELAAGRPPFELILTWSAESLSPRGISVLLEAYAFVGGAHGSLTLKSLNYDPLARGFLELADLVGGAGGLEEVAAECRAELAERIGRRGDLDMDRWIDEGTAPLPENYGVFVFGAGSATVIFPPYQVAPWSDGVQRVELPLIRP